MKASLMLVICLLGPLSATAETVVLQPGQQKGWDSYCSQQYPATNYGEVPRLYITTADHGDASRHALAAFEDLAYHLGRIVVSAELEFWVFYMESDGGRVSLGACDYWWSEDSVTWNTNMTIHPDTLQRADYPDGAEAWWSIDVTTIVQRWLDDDFANYGFLLYDPGSGADNLALSASEYSPDPNLRPRLVLELSDAETTPASFGEIKAEFH